MSKMNHAKVNMQKRISRETYHQAFTPRPTSKATHWRNPKRKKWKHWLAVDDRDTKSVVILCQKIRRRCEDRRDSLGADMAGSMRKQLLKRGALTVGQVNWIETYARFLRLTIVPRIEKYFVASLALHNNEQWRRLYQQLARIEAAVKAL